MYKKAPADYYDFTSLYPYVEKVKRYMVGYPEVISGRDDIDPLAHFGIAKVVVCPPRKLLIPVLPYRSAGKLMFPLCRTCVDALASGECACTDEERCWVGTYCTPELHKAAEMGYTFPKCYEVYHWTETSQLDGNVDDGLFAGYVNRFLKLKQESSGYPSWVESEGDRVRYVKEYAAREGIQLTPDKIAKNPGMRYISKLLLNTHWGVSHLSVCHLSVCQRMLVR